MKYEFLFFFFGTKALRPRFLVMVLYLFLKVVKVALDVHANEASGDILVFLTGKDVFFSRFIL